MAFALLAGAVWAAYILLSAQTGRRWPGLDGLAVASVIATLLLTPGAIAWVATRSSTRGSSRSGAAVGLLSSVIPYSFEMSALRTIRPAVFSILMSLEPAAAALAGILVLRSSSPPSSGSPSPASSWPASAPPAPAGRSPSRYRTRPRLAPRQVHANVTCG